MAASPQDLPDEPASQPYEELQNNGIHAPFTPAAHRLYWPLDGVFPSTVSVMKTPRSPHDLESFFLSEEGPWHGIAREPLTAPKVSSIEVSIADLD
jgi:hypothetical protein